MTSGGGFTGVAAENGSYTRHESEALMSRRSWLGRTIVLTVLLLLAPQPQAEAGCYVEAICPGNNGCAALPTSLHPVDTNNLEPYDNGEWSTVGSPCGSRSCWLFFTCDCGWDTPLTSGSCNF
jgi:hypothetical protein